MKKFGELISRVTHGVRARYGAGEHICFSVKGMTQGELMDISERGASVAETIKPILLEYEHTFLEAYSRNPNMTGGEFLEYLQGQVPYAIEQAVAELGERARRKA